MNAGPSPLERRYRRLLHLLPTGHRRARGEELLGLLMDIDHGRQYPSARETLSVLALAIRLRLHAISAAAVAPVTVVLGALLIAFYTEEAGFTLDLFTGGADPSAMHDNLAVWPQLVGYSALYLAPAAAWLLGAARTALVLHVGLIAALSGRLIFFSPKISTYHLVLHHLVPVAILALLAVAAARRWTPPRPRVLWWALIPLGTLAWKGLSEWGRHREAIPTAVSTNIPVAVAVATAIGAIVVGRRWPAAIIIAGLAGCSAAWLTSPQSRTITVPQVIGYSLPLAIVIAGLAAAITAITRITAATAHTHHHPPIRPDTSTNPTH
jgi:hypothetical protein